MLQDQTSATEALVELAKLLGPAALAILSAYLAYSFANRHSANERKRSFLLRQVTEFYSPIVGIRSRIRSLSELRVEITGIADVAWTKTLEDAPLDNSAFSEHVQREFRPFDRLIEYNNRQLREELLPLYERMLQLFGEHYWLALPSTRAHFDELVKFVELWKRHLDESLPERVLRQIQHSEAALEPLYTNLTTTLDSLIQRPNE